MTEWPHLKQVAEFYLNPSVGNDDNDLNFLVAEHKAWNPAFEKHLAEEIGDATADPSFSWLALFAAAEGFGHQSEVEAREEAVWFFEKYVKT